MVFRLVLLPEHFRTYARDGKTIVRDIAGPTQWQIEGSPGLSVPAADASSRAPFTTVNTAIVYLLKAKKANRDPEIRKNAGDAIAALLRAQ